MISIPRILWCAVVLFCALASCSSKAKFEIKGLKLIQNESLRHTVEGYYEAEHARNWGTAYSYRSANFKKLIPLNYYKSSMQSSFSGWEMRRVDVKAVNCHGLDCDISIEFIESMNKIASDKYTKGLASTMVQTEDTVWRKNNDMWVAVNAGNRSHIPLNADMADN